MVNVAGVNTVRTQCVSVSTLIMNIWVRSREIKFKTKKKLRSSIHCGVKR